MNGLGFLFKISLLYFLVFYIYYVGWAHAPQWCHVEVMGQLVAITFSLYHMGSREWTILYSNIIQEFEKYC